MNTLTDTDTETNTNIDLSEHIRKYFGDDLQQILKAVHSDTYDNALLSEGDIRQYNTSKELQEIDFFQPAMRSYILFTPEIKAEL